MVGVTGLRERKEGKKNVKEFKMGLATDEERRKKDEITLRVHAESERAITARAAYK